MVWEGKAYCSPQKGTAEEFKGKNATVCGTTFTHITLGEASFA